VVKPLVPKTHDVAPVLLAAPAGATTALVAAAAGYQVWVTGLAASITATGAGMTITFKDSAGTALTGVMSYLAGTPIVWPQGPIALPYLRTATGLGLSVTTVNCTLNGTFSYFLVKP